MLEERAHPGDAHPEGDMVSVTTSHRYSKQGRMNFLFFVSFVQDGFNAIRLVKGSLFFESGRNSKGGLGGVSFCQSC